jgi:hypothetical protein
MNCDVFQCDKIQIQYFNIETCQHSNVKRIVLILDYFKPSDRFLVE